MPILVCGLALIPVWPVARNFSSDWYNHLWLIEYAGYHLWLTGTPTEVLNTPQAVGMPMLLFYGQKFYTVLGALSFTLGSALTVRVAAFVVLMLQFGHVRRAARASRAPASLCLALPVLVTWQVFQAITLYERGDVPEYFAVAFLTIAVANLYVLAVRTSQRLSDAYGFWTTGLYYGLAAVTHPLTAVYGGAFVALTGLSVLLAVRGKRMLRFAAFNLLALGFLLAPWLWVVFRYANHTTIAGTGANAETVAGLFASPPILTLLRAFSPNSFCSFSSGVSLASLLRASASLNIQLSLPLFVLAIGLLIACRRIPIRRSATVPVLRTLLVIAYGLFWISLLVFCSPGTSLLFGHAFDILQFAYRLGVYVNLALLLGNLVLFGLVDWHQIGSMGFGPLLTRLSAATLVSLSGIGWFSKCSFIEVSHFYGEGIGGLETLLRKKHFETRTSGYWVPGVAGQDDTYLTDLPTNGYFESAYDVVDGLRSGYVLSADTPVRSIPFELGKPFGSVMPQQVDLRRRTLVMTNVNPFPWNQLVLDGNPVPARELLAVPSLYAFHFGHLLHPRACALFIGEGRHTLAYRFLPDRCWRWLDFLSWLTLTLWLAGSICVAGLRLRNRMRPLPPILEADLRQAQARIMDHQALTRPVTDKRKRDIQSAG